MLVLAVGQAQDRVSSPVKAKRSTTVPRNQQLYMFYRYRVI